MAKLCYHYLLIVATIVTSIDGQKGRKRDIMEDTQKTVNQIWQAIDKFDQRTTVMEMRLMTLATKVDKIVDSMDNHRLANQLLVDRLQAMELKMDSAETTINNRINHVADNVIKVGNDSDAKLRKLMNVVFDTYDLSKDANGLLKGVRSRSGTVGGGYIGNGDDGDGEGSDQIDELKKKVLEQMSIMEARIRGDVSGVGQIGKDILGTLDTFNQEMLDIRAECSDKKQANRPQQQQQISDKVFDSIYTDQQQQQQQQQCGPTNGVNMTAIKHEMDVHLEQIGVRIENEMSIIGSKLEEYVSQCTAATSAAGSHPNLKARSILPDNTPPVIVHNASSSSGNVEFTASSQRKTIRLANRPLGASSCQRSSHLLAPKSCGELYTSGANCDGVYVISVANSRLLRVYCDMSDNGGGWTVILRRGDFGRSRYRISFEQSWTGYRDGFGDRDTGEFWLGLESVHQMTAVGNHQLLVELESFDGDYVSIVYDGFRVGGESDNYRLHLGQSISANTTVGQSLLAHNGSLFSTHDRNNNLISRDNCALKLQAGWWYHNCQSALLTAPYYGRTGRQHVWQGIQWHSWKHSQHLKAAQMKIRPKY
ncbi:angiopoietin-related protein 6-like [Oppia nitens]|uniref:angiopoietin-related protein 6-like n=1 Tax=Oppia nitens TaxID=1686743 RepID=UPI0023DB020C|nr:angiopoietin-related protein 6-like [Oppia nitens]